MSRTGALDHKCPHRKTVGTFMVDSLCSDFLKRRPRHLKSFAPQHKYSITTTERIRHFLTQCFAESGTRLPLEAGTNKYRGSGAIQITNEYNYKAFATLMLTTNFPDLPIVFLSPAHNNKTSISNMYEYAVTEAESLSIDEEKLKKFTDIVTLGAEYVSINFVWESAGYFWLANDLESMVDSFPVNSSAHVDYVTAVVNSNSNNYERRRNIYMIVAQYII